ncbi:MAG TPA: uracil-DNA glycosylase [Gemmatimonadales bacterium]|nr:uracil-DNA glycosylase [Gemmatimonadales bacterium]
MNDGRALARAFLEQQRDLGGDAVVVSETGAPPAGALAAAPGLPTPTPIPEPHRRADVVAEGRASASPPRAVAEPPSAPLPLPPPGLSYDPPGGDLFATDPVQQAGSLAAIAALVAACTKCRLCESRARTVPGEGPADARLVVVGEGPGRVEDETGRPFVGQAGELLTKILAAIEWPRERVFICNVVKCRPPENRVPQYDEVAACLPYLFRQIELLQPHVILAMGGTAAQALLDTKQSLGALRNQVHRFRGIPVIVTYHPAALLRNPNWKKPTWDDVRIARRLLG